MIPARPFWGKSLRWLLMRPSSDAVVEGDCNMLSGEASDQAGTRLREVVSDIGAASRIIGNKIATDSRTRARRCIADTEGICQQPSSCLDQFQHGAIGWARFGQAHLWWKGDGASILNDLMHCRGLDSSIHDQRCAPSSLPPGLHYFPTESRCSCPYQDSAIASVSCVRPPAPETFFVR